MDAVLKNRSATLIMLLPALAVYTLVMLIPIFWSVGYSFTEGNVLRGFEFVGVDNYVEFFRDPTALKALWFTLRFAVIETVLQIAAGYGLALLYTFYLKHRGAIIRTVIFFPVILPTVAVALMFRRIFQSFDPQGPVNSFIGMLSEGYLNDPIDWLGTPTSVFWIMIFLDLWRSMGFYAVLLYAGIIEIPKDMLEAARVDGASGFRLVRTIVLPLSLPVLLSATIFSINGTLKVFDTVRALAGQFPSVDNTPLTLYMFNTAFAYGEYGYGSTVAMVLAIIALLASTIVFRSLRRDNS